MDDQTQQQHSGSGDNIKGDKINNIIRNENVNTNTIHIQNADKLRPEDEKEFGMDVPRSKIKEYRNLLNQVDFHADLGEFETAQKLIQNANLICHNHHITLSYNALCVYALSNVRLLTINNSITDKIIKLLKKAKELDGASDYYKNISITIADNFFSLVKDNLIYLKDTAPKHWRRITIERQQLYYSAITKFLFKLETCFEINENIEYLKTFVNNLCGQEGYPWINLTEKGEIDFGKIFLGEPTIDKISKLEKKIQEKDENYKHPEILYGDYFNTPRNKKQIFSIKNKQRLGIVISSIIILLACLSPLILGYEFWDYFKYFLSFIIIALIFQPWGDSRMNILEKISRYIYKKVIFKKK